MPHFSRVLAGNQLPPAPGSSTSSSSQGTPVVTCPLIRVVAVARPLPAPVQKSLNRSRVDGTTTSKDSSRCPGSLIRASTSRSSATWRRKVAVPLPTPSGSVSVRS